MNDELNAIKTLITDDIQQNPAFRWLGRLLQNFLISYLVIYRLFGQNLFLICVANDGLFSAIEVFIGVVVGRKYRLHTVDVVDRYLLYLGLWVVELYLRAMFWGTGFVVWHLALSTLSGFMFTNVLCKVFELEKISSLIYDCRDYVLCKLVAKCLKFMNERVFQEELIIDWREIKIQIAHIGRDNLRRFVRAVVLAGILSQLKGVLLIPWVLELLYRAGVLVPGEVIDVKGVSPREKVHNMVQWQQWRSLENPYMIHDIFVVLASSPRQDLMRRVRVWLKRLRGSIAKFVAIWSLIVVFEVPGIGLVFSLLMHWSDNMDFWGIKLLGGAVAWFYGELAGAFIYEFGEYFIKDLAMWVWNELQNLFAREAWRFYSVTKYNKSIIYTAVGLFALNYISGLIGILFLHMNKHFLILLWFAALGVFSNYSLFHLVVLGFLLWTSLNLALAQKPQITEVIVEDYQRARRSVTHTQNLQTFERIVADRRKSTTRVEKIKHTSLLAELNFEREFTESTCRARSATIDDREFVHIEPEYKVFHLGGSWRESSPASDSESWSR